MGKVILGLCAILCIVFFQNCSSEIKVTESLSCSPSVKASLQMMKFKANTHCSNHDFYSCEMRVFSPYVDDGENSSEQCVHVNGLGHGCVPVKTRNFSTKTMITSEDPKFFEEGSAYNYSEIECSNLMVLHNEKTIFRAEGASIQEAMANVVKACLERQI